MENLFESGADWVDSRAALGSQANTPSASLSSEKNPKPTRTTSSGGCFTLGRQEGGVGAASKFSGFLVSRRPRRSLGSSPSRWEERAGPMLCAGLGGGGSCWAATRARGEQQTCSAPLAALTPRSPERSAQRPPQRSRERPPRRPRLSQLCLPHTALLLHQPWPAGSSLVASLLQSRTSTVPLPPSPLYCRTKPDGNGAAGRLLRLGGCVQHREWGKALAFVLHVL